MAPLPAPSTPASRPLYPRFRTLYPRFRTLYPRTPAPPVHPLHFTHYTLRFLFPFAELYENVFYARVDCPILYMLRNINNILSKQCFYA